MPAQPTRAEIPVEVTWNLADIYPTTAAWEADFQTVEAALPALVAFRGRLGESAATLLAFLKARDEAAERYEKVLAYGSLGYSTDGLDAIFQAMNARASSLGARIGAALAFVPNELLALPAGTVEGFLDADSGLAPYRAQLEYVLRRRGHVLVPQAEEALAALDETLELPYTIWQVATAADMVCRPVADSAGRENSVSIARWVFGVSRSPDRELRRRSYESLAHGLDRHKHTLATTLTTNVERNVALAKLRGYGSAVEMILAPQRVPEGVYRGILQTVHDGMKPHIRRLIALRRRVLGIDRMHHYDLEAPLDPSLETPLDYAGCARLIREGLAGLGDEYGQIVADALAGRWIDRADNVGKRSGAYSRGVYGVHPYVFTTWQDQLRSALVLAHELGHTGHSALSSRAQPISNVSSGGSAAFTGASMPLFFIEAPSTANEMLMGQYLIDTAADPRVRRFIVEQFLGTFTHNMVTHLLEGRFEQRLYDLAEAHQPLTTGTVLDAQAVVFGEFYGDALAADEGARLYWAQQPHFYRGLYSYTYSAGLACGVGVAASIRAEGRPAVDRWLDTLRCGTTLSPIELAAKAGVDMRTTTPLERAVAYFGTLVDELEAGYA
jgi:oligoendopeptidase F